MTIDTNCPSCGADYHLADHQAGKQVRCRHCDATFEVPQVPEVLTMDALPAPERDPRPTRFPPPPLVDRPPSSHKESKGWGLAFLIIGIITVVVGLPLLACGTGVYFIVRGVQRTVKNIGEELSPHDPNDVDEAISYLTSTNPIKVQKGCKWIAAHKINDDDQARVAKALDPLLTDTNYMTRVEAARALKKYPSKDNVRSLIAALDGGDPIWNANEAAETRRLAIDMLAQLNDERAITPIAGRLKDPKDRPYASRALIDFGARSAPEVKRLLDDQDAAVRDEARKILKAVVPEENNDVVFGLSDLKSADVNRRLAGARTLQIAKVDAKQQAAVRAALDSAIRTGTHELRYESACALRNWATLDDVDVLVQALTLWCADDPFQSKNPDTRKVILETLGNLRAERAIPTIVDRLRDRSDRPAAGKALVQIGGVKVARELRRLEGDDADQLVRDEARRLLQDLHGERIDLARTLKDLASPVAAARKSAAEELAGKVANEEQRKSISRALDPLVADDDDTVRLAALQALVGWATTDNVPSLTKALEGGSPAMRVAAIDAIAQIRQPAVAQALVKRMPDDTDRDLARKGLIRMGSAAETAVLTMLESPDASQRKEGCAILRSIGTPAGSLQRLQKATLMDNDDGVKAEAHAAILEVMKRR